jgi:hypothetical protein
VPLPYTAAIQECSSLLQSSAQQLSIKPAQDTVASFPASILRLKAVKKTRQGTRLTTTQCSVANPCQSPIAKPIPAAVSILGIVSSCFQHQQTRIIPIPQREVVSPAMLILYGRLFAAWAAIGTDLMGVFLVRFPLSHFILLFF